MSNPSELAISLILGRVTDWTQSNESIVSYLNVRDIPNTDTQGQVGKPFSFADVFGVLSGSTISAIRDLPTGTDLISKVNGGDVQGVLHWLVALSAPPAKILPSEVVAVQGVLSATTGDPDWLPELSWSELNLGRFVDVSDIQAARENR